MNANNTFSLFSDTTSTEEYAEQTTYNRQVQIGVFEEMDAQYLLSIWSERRKIKSIYRLALEQNDDYNIIVFGTGRALDYTLAKMNECFLSPVYLCDNDTRKHNTKIKGLVVISPTELKKKQNVRIVISGNNYLHTIYDQLCDIGIPKENIYKTP